MHNKVLYKLNQRIKTPDYIIVDEFAKEHVYYHYLKESSHVVKNITFLTKGETKSLAVATASLISRYIFLKEFDKLGESVGMFLPKGAGPKVDEVASTIATKYGFEKLNDMAKLNFKNVEKIKEITNK